MSRLLCCRRARQADMGAALSHPQEGEACDGAGVPAAPPTMADVIRERKKKAGGAGLGTLRRRIAAAARRPRDSRPDRGCEHARFIRSVVSSWRLAEVFLLCEELEAGAALRDLVTQAELAREPAAALHADLAAAHRDRRWCDVELGGAGWALGAHRAVLAARCQYFRDLLQRYPNCSRVPLEGAGAALSRDEAAAVLRALYGGGHAPHAPHAQRTRADYDHAHKWERGADPEADLDIINDNSSACTCASRGACGAGAGGGGGEAGLVRRLGALLGFSPDTLQQDMRYLLESGEYADARLVFGAEAACGAGAAYGFRGGLELPAHRVLLAARSRYLRELLARRPRAPPPPHAHAHAHAHPALVCLDENVLPRRFARALLHAAYTDQVDLSLVGRCSSSPCSTGSGSGGTMAWAGVSRGGGSRGASTALLDDAFQLYEIARFLEMPIVVQGCEDAIVEALCADTLPHVLRWAAAPHASQWVHRQAMRYLRDEFPAVMAASSSSRLPRAALAQALASPFLQASEAQAMRALLRWAPGRAGGAGGAGDEAAERELASLVALVRTEHLPPEHELLAQAARRGLLRTRGWGAARRGARAASRRTWRSCARCCSTSLCRRRRCLWCAGSAACTASRTRCTWWRRSARAGAPPRRARRPSRARRRACPRGRCARCATGCGSCALRRPRRGRSRCPPASARPSTGSWRCARCASARCPTRAPTCCWQTPTRTRTRTTTGSGTVPAARPRGGPRRRRRSAASPPGTSGPTVAGYSVRARCAVRRRPAAAAPDTCTDTSCPAAGRAGASRPRPARTRSRTGRARREGAAVCSAGAAGAGAAARPGAGAGCRRRCRTWRWRPTPTRTCCRTPTTSGTRRPGSTAEQASPGVGVQARVWAGAGVGVCCSWTWGTAPRTRRDRGPARSERRRRSAAATCSRRGWQWGWEPGRGRGRARPTRTSCWPPSSEACCARTRRRRPAAAAPRPPRRRRRAPPARPARPAPRCRPPTAASWRPHPRRPPSPPTRRVRAGWPWSRRRTGDTISALARARARAAAAAARARGATRCTGCGSARSPSGTCAGTETSTDTAAVRRGTAGGRAAARAGAAAPPGTRDAGCASRPGTRASTELPPPPPPPPAGRPTPRHQFRAHAVRRVDPGPSGALTKLTTPYKETKRSCG